MQAFVSFSDTFRAFVNGILTVEDLTGASFFFACGRGYIFCGEDVIPVDAARAFSRKFDDYTLGYVEISSVSEDNLRLFYAFRDIISDSPSFYRIRYYREAVYLLLKNGYDVFYDGKPYGMSELCQYELDSFAGCEEHLSEYLELWK